MKFIRDIISEKRAQAQGRSRMAAEPAPRAAEFDAMPKAPPLPQDVIAAPRAPAAAKPTFQLPLSAMVVEDAEDLLNLLNPKDPEDRAQSALDTDNFDFGSDDDVDADDLADEDLDDEDLDDDDIDDDDLELAAIDDGDLSVDEDIADAEDTADALAAQDAVSEDAVQDVEALGIEASAEEAVEDDNAGTELLDLDGEDQAEDSVDADDDLLAMEDEDAEPEDLSAEADIEEPEIAADAPVAQPVSREGLFSAIAEANLPETDDDAPMATGLWTGAMPGRAPVPPQAAAPQRPAAPAQAVPQRPAMAQAPAPQPRPAMTQATAPQPQPAPTAESVDVPAPAIGRASRRAGRVKTRLLGFNGGQSRTADPFAAVAVTRPAEVEEDAAAPQQGPDMFPVGWLVVVAGPGVGASFPLHDGVAQIGRGAGQTVRLDLGDNSISRENHAAIAYDSEQRKFYLGHGGKANLVRLNNRPVLSTEELATGNLIRIGETTLRFVALCGSDFDWSAVQEGAARNASFG